jgi:hypothetical protein
MHEFLGQWSQKTPAMCAAAFREAVRRAACGAATGGIVDMGLSPAKFDPACKDPGIARFACATTLAEARATEPADANSRTGCRGRRASRRV